MIKIPTSQTIDAQWFTAILQANDIDCEVASFEAARVGTGQIGKCIRYTLTYHQSAPGAPQSLIVKYPSDDPTSRATGVLLRNFLKEVRFYQEMQHRLSIRTPVCYYAEIVDEGPEFVVVMSDLAPAEQGNQLEGCTPQVAQAAVFELVGLHAPCWCDDSLSDYEWLGGSDAAGADAMRDLYRAQLPGFLDRYGIDLAEDEQAIIAKLGEAEAAPLYQTDHPWFSLVHVDYRLDNLLISERDGATDITVVDWQSITTGAPLNDVAYFLGAGMLPDQRAQHEASIVRAYHEGLLNAGIENFDWETCWDQYRRGVFAGFGVTVVASMIVERTERGDAMFTTMAKRHARHAIDLGGAEFLV
ncbi:MAG: phosphotransferase [Pseudomonadota bacterium]